MTARGTTMCRRGGGRHEAKTSENSIDNGTWSSLSRLVWDLKQTANNVAHNYDGKQCERMTIAR